MARTVTKKIPLTQGQFALVDDYEFIKLNKYKWYAAFYKPINGFYAHTSMIENGKRKIVKMHRFILGVTDKDIEIDHKNHNTLDNRRFNLRPSTRAENQANRTSQKNSSSKYLGVSWDRESLKWQAEIMKDGKKVYLGKFRDEICAAAAYDIKARKLHGKYANLNLKKGLLTLLLCCTLFLARSQAYLITGVGITEKGYFMAELGLNAQFNRVQVTANMLDVVNVRSGANFGGKIGVTVYKAGSFAVTPAAGLYYHYFSSDKTEYTTGKNYFTPAYFIKGESNKWFIELGYLRELNFRIGLKLKL